MKKELRLESTLDIICKKLGLSPTRVESLKKAYGEVCDNFPEARDWEVFNAFTTAERSRGVSYKTVMTNALLKSSDRH